MNANQININFNRAVSKANELDEIAEALQKLAERDFDESMQNLSQGWQSDSSGEFLHKGTMLEMQMKKSADDLKKVGTSIRSSARRIRDAELRALEIARQRSYTN